MTECIGGPVEEFAERYLNGSLPEDEAESFENHYFACQICHEMLLALQDVQASLVAGSDASAATGPAQPLRIVSRRDVKPVQLGTPWKFVKWGSIAAAILVAAGLTTVALNRQTGTQTAGKTPYAPLPAQANTNAVHPEKSQPPKSIDSNANVEVASLADVRLPGYHAPELRGSEPPSAAQDAFESAMRSYAQGDCGSALAQFARVPDNSQHGVAARLYGGLCRFKAHELLQAQTSFERVIAAGDTPQLETAEYYLAQTLLLRSDATTARVWLRRTVALHGDYQVRAQTQLSQLVHLSRQRMNMP